MIFYGDVKEQYGLEIDFAEWQPRGLSVNLGASKNLNSYKLHLESMQWVPWIDPDQIDIKDFLDLSYQHLIIPTQDSVRNNHLMQMLIESDLNVMLIGPTGTGKTLGAKQFISELYCSSERTNITTAFSAQTQVNQV